jgi:hypothetical protein
LTVYAPGTLERDPQKQNMALQQHAGQLQTANTSIAANTAAIAANTTAIAALNSATHVDSIDGKNGAFTTSHGVTTSTNDIQADFAIAAEMQTGTSTTKVVNPARVNDHDGAAKTWVMFTGRGTNGTCTLNASYNVASVTRTALGLYTIAFTTSFSSASYVCIGASNGTTTDGNVEFITQAAGSIVAVFNNKTGTALFDPVNGAYIVGYGRQ